MLQGHIPNRMGQTGTAMDAQLAAIDKFSQRNALTEREKPSSHQAGPEEPSNPQRPQQACHYQTQLAIRDLIEWCCYPNQVVAAVQQAGILRG